MRVNETFLSLQGEGLFAGMPSWFIRFAGCNRACAWCDTDHQFHDYRTPESLQADVPFQIKHVVLTGGEPTLQPTVELKDLIWRLTNKTITVETNGDLGAMTASALYAPHLWFCFSFKDLHEPENWEHAFEVLDVACASKWQHWIKLVVCADNLHHSLNFLEHVQGQYDPVPPLFIQPQAPHETLETIYKLWSTERMGEIRLLPQIHKLFNLK